MKKATGWTLLAAAAVSLAYAQGSGTSVLQAFVKTVNEAQALHVVYTTQLIGGSTTEYTVVLAKPDRARIESPSQLIVADGTNIITYDKAGKTYFKDPQTQEKLLALFKSEDVSLWEPFFNAKAYDKAVSVKSKGEKTLGGAKYRLVEVQKDARGQILQTLFIDEKNIARRQQIDVKDGQGTVTSLLLSKTLDTSSSAAQPGDFTFTAPEGSREVTLEEMSAATWYYDLEEGKKAAAKTKRRIFVDFYADW